MDRCPQRGSPSQSVYRFFPQVQRVRAHTHVVEISSEQADFSAE
ncbi:hypothetical protein ACFFX0_17200 [Citricoccus parietis]|uniref:Uncharacterized protein n=1 Tax=Citricoccus parietis TaxID=592307 RepID=A0ABV5G2F8_9MICC